MPNTKLHPYVDEVYKNYCEHTAEMIKKNPKNWLCSLPMYEYNHTLAQICFYKHGGTLDQYTTLYNNTISPQLSEYYKELAKYRINLAIIKRNYFSYQDRQEQLNVITKHSYWLTAQTRQWLRNTYTQFVQEILQQTVSSEFPEETVEEEIV